MQSKASSHALVLGLLSAIGLFALDMYLPALPTIAANLKADSHAVQASLISFFAAMAVSQIVYGPLSDMFGRKRPLYVGLVLYGIGAIGCALSPSIEWLIAFRFLQGMGACAGVVISRVIVRDLHTGPAAAQLMSRLMLVFSVSPILAPLAGSIVTTFGDWRLIFLVMVAAGVVGLVVAVFFLEETRLPAARSESSIGSRLKGLWHATQRSLLSRPRVHGLVRHVELHDLCGQLVLRADRALRPVAILLQRGVLGECGRLHRHVAAERLVVPQDRVAQGHPRCGLRLRHDDGGACCRHLVRHRPAGCHGRLPVRRIRLPRHDHPDAAVLALEHHGRIAGTASAMMGTIQFITSAIVVGLGGLFVDGTSRPMVTVIGICSVIVFLLSLLVLRSRQGAKAAAE